MLAQCLSMGAVRAAGGGASLLPGALLEWLFADGSGYSVRNESYTPVGTARNLFRCPEGCFRGPNFWGNHSFVTNDFADGPFEGTHAARFNADSTSMDQLVRVPAGQFTLSVYVMSNTGTAQQVRMLLNGDYGTDIDIPSSGWVRISRTTTYADVTTDDLAPLVTPGSTNLADVLFFGPLINPGATPLDYEVDSGQLTFKGNPAWTAAGVDFSGGTNAAAASKPNVAISDGLAVYAAFRWPLANAADDDTFVSILTGEGDPNTGDGTYYLTAHNGGVRPGFNIANRQALGRLSPDLKDGLWHLVAGIYDGSSTHLFIDDVEVASTAGAINAPFDLQAISIASIHDGEGRMPGEFAFGALYDQAHTSDNVFAQFAAVKALLQARGESLVSPDIIFFEGDSITADGGGSVDTYPFQLTFPAHAQARDFGVSGSIVSDLTARAGLLDINARPGRSNTLVLMIGFNDMNTGDSAATLLTNVTAYCLARRAAGWDNLILTTVLPSTSPGLNTKRNAYNALIRSDSSFYDTLVDFDNTTMGPDAAAADTDLYADGTHPTEAGHLVLATYLQPFITP